MFLELPKIQEFAKYKRTLLPELLTILLLN